MGYLPRPNASGSYSRLRKKIWILFEPLKWSSILVKAWFFGAFSRFLQDKPTLSLNCIGLKMFMFNSSSKLKSKPHYGIFFYTSGIYCCTFHITSDDHSGRNTRNTGSNYPYFMGQVQANPTYLTHGLSYCTQYNC